MFYANWGLNFNNTMFGMTNPYFGFANPFMFNPYMIRFNMVQSFIGNMLNGSRGCNCNHNIRHFQPIQQQPVLQFRPNVPSVDYSKIQPMFSNSDFENYMARKNVEFSNNLTNIFKQAYETSFSLSGNQEHVQKFDVESLKSDENIFAKPSKKAQDVKKPTKAQAKIDENFKNNGKLGKDFLNRVKQMAKNLNCDYKDLLAVINSESGFNPKANNNGIAVGLTQFTDTALAELKRVHGISVTKQQILNMSPLEQLDLAEKYLLIAKSYTFDKNARLTAADLYALNFLPGRANREILCTKGEINPKTGKLYGFYEGPGNASLDTNKDNNITKTELGARIASKYVDDSLFV